MTLLKGQGVPLGEGQVAGGVEGLTEMEGRVVGEFQVLKSKLKIQVVCIFFSQELLGSQMFSYPCV